jgi:hypothetical protein
MIYRRCPDCRKLLFNVKRGFCEYCYRRKLSQTAGILAPKGDTNGLRSR